VVKQKSSKSSNGSKSKAKRPASTPSTGSTMQIMTTLGMGMVLNAETPSTTKIEKMSMKKFTTGSLAMGYILQVYSNHLVISLPGGFTGMVDIDDVSDYFHQVHQEGNGEAKASLPSLSSLFSPWQPVSCYIHGVKERLSSKSDKNFIKLSLRSSLINKGLALKHLIVGFVISGCVSSIEDHG
jgi:rRNA biogenesis protein RRP5